MGLPDPARIMAIARDPATADPVPHLIEKDRGDSSMSRGILLASVFMLALGCAGAKVREGAVTVAPGEAAVDLKAESYYFTPANLAVPAEKPVVIRIQNEATVIPHSFVLENSSGNVILRQTLRKGGETLIRLAPLPAGVYTFYCDKSFLGMSHRKKGMEGKLEARGG